MKSRPIIFSGESVRAILEGRKTQTRRVVKHPVSVEQKSSAGVFIHDPMASHKGLWWKPAEWSPFGIPDDRLWVRETWRPCECQRCNAQYSHGSDPIHEAEYRADGDDPHGWRSPLFMPRAYSRLTLEVVNVRVERVQEISEQDAKAEGVIVTTVNISNPEKGFNMGDPLESYRDVYALSWDFLNAKRGYSWASNPWVWVVEFKVDTVEHRR